jgi:hypothetical protein
MDLTNKQFNRKYYDPKRGDKIYDVAGTCMICYSDSRPPLLLSSISLPVDILVLNPYKYDTRWEALEIKQ